MNDQLSDPLHFYFGAGSTLDAMPVSLHTKLGNSLYNSLYWSLVLELKNSIVRSGELR